jgi:hypothetical protein
MMIEARGVSGGYRIWDGKVCQWWGDLDGLCPDEWLGRPEGEGDYARITALLRRYAAKR